jgi:hypothetical protein
MNDLPDSGRQGRFAWAPARVLTLARAMRVDLAWLHRTWMAVGFPERRGSDDAVVDRWRPRTTRGVAAYRLWAVLGALLLVVVYPLFVLGLATRFYARRIDRLSASLGFLGVALLSLLAWGALSAITYLSPVAFEGFVSVVVAGVVATASAVLALGFTRQPGRLSTVALGYPFGVTALFLPPVVASLYSPTLAAIVFPSSQSIAIWLLDNVLAVGGVAAFIRASFDLQGVAYVGMWFVLAVPTGWILGALVTLTNRARPAGASNALGNDDTDLRW